MKPSTTRYRGDARRPRRNWVRLGVAFSCVNLLGCGGNAPPTQQVTPVPATPPAESNLLASEPPLPDRLDDLDPFAAASIRQAVDSVGEAPQSVPRWLELAMIYQARDIFELADACYTQVLRRSADYDRALFYRATVRHELGRTADAIDDFEAVAAITPGYAPNHWRLGFVLLESGQLDRAGAAFSRATEIDPEEATAWIGLARVELSRGEMPGAIRALERAAAIPSANVGYANLLLSRAYQQVGRAADAEAALAAAGTSGLVKSDPWTDELARYRVSFADRLQVAEVLLAGGRYEDAIRVLSQLLSIQPDHVNARANLGAAFLLKGDLPACIEESTKALNLNPDWIVAHQNLAIAYDTLSQSKPEPMRGELRAMAITHVDRAIALNPTYSRALVLKATMLVRNNHPEEAIDFYLRAARAEQERTDWLLEAARLQYQARRWSDLISTLSLNVGAMHDSAEAHHLVGLALSELGRLEEARQTLQRAAELDPTNIDIQRSLRRFGPAEGDTH